MHASPIERAASEAAAGPHGAAQEVESIDAQHRRTDSRARRAGHLRIEAIDYPRDPESKTPRTGRGV